MKYSNNKETIFYHIERMEALTKRKEELKPKYYREQMSKHMLEIAKLSY